MLLVLGGGAVVEGAHHSVFGVLGVVVQSLDAHTLERVAHVDLESVLVFERGVGRIDKSSIPKANGISDGAEEFNKLTIELCEPFIPPKQVSDVPDLFLEELDEGDEPGIVMLDLGYWGQSNKEVNIISHVVPLFLVRHSVEHLGGAHGVCNVGDLIHAGDGLSYVDRGRKIILSHLLPREVPELFLSLTIWI